MTLRGNIINYKWDWYKGNPDNDSRDGYFEFKED